MKILATFIIFLSLSFNAFPQSRELEDLCQVFHLPDGPDTTTFVVFGNKQDLKVKKPLFIFRQGSQPMPVIHKYGDKYHMPLSPFYFQDYKDQYHFVMISKPGVRLVADSIYLKRYQDAMRSGDTSEEFMSKKYIQNNYRERYVDQCDQVINFLITQRWIDTSKVVYCGGSEGFTVGADLVANRNRHITHAVLFSGNTERRFENIIFGLRKEAKDGLKTEKHVQEEIMNMYEVWSDICRNSKSTEKSFGDSYRAWFSFSIRNLDNLLKIQIPLYVAYGTDDNEIAVNFDMLPIEFEVAGKKNLTFRPYPSYDHQFFEQKKDSKGNITGKTYRGDAVANEWMDWLKMSKN